ncbi:hypothetical protein ACFL2U_02895 [Patescibacteria group bacterium]
MAHYSVTKMLSLVLIHEIKTILYFPLWWYSKGFILMLKGGWNWLKDFEQTLGLMIWVRNLFVPMFGQSDIQGRIISFFLRLFQIIFKGIALILFSLVVLVFVLAWLVLPIFIIYQIVIHI